MVSHVFVLTVVSAPITQSLTVSLSSVLTGSTVRLCFVFLAVSNLLYLCPYDFLEEVWFDICEILYIALLFSFQNLLIDDHYRNSSSRFSCLLSILLGLLPVLDLLHLLCLLHVLGLRHVLGLHHVLSLLHVLDFLHVLGLQRSRASLAWRAWNNQLRHILAISTII